MSVVQKLRAIVGLPILKRANVAAPMVRRETVEVPSLGGAVIVQGLMLADSLEMSRQATKPVVPREGESEEQAHSRNGALVMATMLHLQVVLEDGQPLWSVEQWQAWGGSNSVDFFALYRAALRVSGAPEEVAAKNS